MPRQFVDFNAYIKSEAWKKKSLERFKVDGYRCQICGSAKNLVCHHLTYINLGHEDIDDLLTVCYPCHKELHSDDTRRAPKSKQERHLFECPLCHNKFEESECRMVHIRGFDSLLCDECAEKMEQAEEERVINIDYYSWKLDIGEVVAIKQVKEELGINQEPFKVLIKRLDIETHLAKRHVQHRGLCKVITLSDYHKLRGFVMCRTHRSGNRYVDTWPLNINEEKDALYVNANQKTYFLPLRNLKQGEIGEFFDTCLDGDVETKFSREECKEIVIAYVDACKQTGVIQ